MNLLKELYGKDTLPIIVPKPWGQETIFAYNDRYCGKILSINKGGKLSLQYHSRKFESLYVFDGVVEVTQGDEKFILTSGGVWTNVPNQIHGLEALVNSIVLEVSTSEINDLVRVSDSYGRTGDKP